MNKVNEMLFRRKNAVIIPNLASKNAVNTELNSRYILAALGNLKALGYTLSSDIVSTLLSDTCDEYALKAFLFQTIDIAKELKGDDVEYHPMYPNFPQQVAMTGEAELFVNAFLHYATYGEWLPEYKKQTRFPLIDDVELITIVRGTEVVAKEIFDNLVNSKTSLSEQDKDDMKLILSEYPDVANALPDVIPFKENVAYISRLLLENGLGEVSIAKYYHTATDVLRLLTELSDGDTSLATNTKFISFPRKTRRAIMNMLLNCTNRLEDMYRYREKWLRVGEKIHAGEFSNNVKYASVAQDFYTLRNEKSPMLFNAYVEQYIKERSVNLAIAYLRKRPGEFARRLDKLLRICHNQTEMAKVYTEFEKVSTNVSTPVLLQVRTHFNNRAYKTDNAARVFFPKGQMARATAIPNNLKPIPVPVCVKLIRICDNALKTQYAEREQLGKVYISPEFQNYLVPFSQRSASATSKPLVRGSKFTLDGASKAIRAFIWWTNTAKSRRDDNRVDIDLSACIYDENFNYISHLSYTSLINNKYHCYHSGDITDGGSIKGKGVAEFIDIDISSVAKNARYVAFQVYSYTQQPFASLPNCRFGWMERQDVQSGEIFEPSTVQMTMPLSVDNTVALPVIFDCVKREFIWCDMSVGLPRDTFFGNNLESNFSSITATCYALTHMSKATLADLITLNAFARGEITYDRNKADIIFDNNIAKPTTTIRVYEEVDGEQRLIRTETREKDVPIITAYDIDYYMGQLL